MKVIQRLFSFGFLFWAMLIGLLMWICIISVAVPKMGYSLQTTLSTISCFIVAFIVLSLKRGWSHLVFMLSVVALALLGVIFWIVGHLG